ncbi:uncharacterized protein IL334_003290 [Kwoniella shivajii]|uniref:DUF6534 domain-containing protein n=1 Tax=Kwoniella shivajii TaxID=564305 RepID=A0ABZ1CYT2_9TREE|nr:hypothetical protein IL334_003290 [Kwoniella shivajii]
MFVDIIARAVPDDAQEEAAKERVLSDPVSILLPFLLAFVLDAMLYGILIQQYFFWLFHSASKERRPTRVVVSATCMLSTVKTLFTNYWMVLLFAKDFGTHWSKFFDGVFLAWCAVWGGLILPIAQTFFAIRAYRLNGNTLIVPIIIVPLLLVEMAGGIGIRITASHDVISSQSNGARELEATFVFLYTIGGAVTDIALMIMICVGLRRSRTGWSNTDRLIKKLVLISLEAQIPGTLISVATALEYGISPTSSWIAVFAIIQPKVYIVSLLVLLNTRSSIKRTLEGPQVHVNQFPTPPAIQQQIVNLDQFNVHESMLSDHSDDIATPRFNGNGRLHVTDREDVKSVGFTPHLTYNQPQRSVQRQSDDEIQEDSKEFIRHVSSW